MIRQISENELGAAADFLDSRTLALRWLVGLLRRRSWDLEASGGRFSLWWGLREGAGGGGGARQGLGGICCVLAHFRANETLYVGGDSDADFATTEELCRLQLHPARVVGDTEVIDAWKKASPPLFESAVRASDLDLLVYEGGATVPAGFRPAHGGDADTLREYLRLLYGELEEIGPPSMDDLIEAGLVHVLQEASRVKGMILSNPSDGRYVHGSGVYVHPLYRGQGVGRRLAEGLGAVVLGDLGVRVILDAYHENVRALAAYRAAGYRIRGTGRVVWLGPRSWEDDGPIPFGGDVEDG